MPDHLHLFVELAAKLSLSDFVRDLKTSTAKWLTNNPLFPYFQGWGKGYAAFSYGLNEKDKIINYIMTQKEHHQSSNFETELRRLLGEHGCTIDEKYFMKDDD